MPQRQNGLTHPNIATIHDFDSQDGVDFLVMEFITGTTLSHKLRSEGLSEKEVIALGLQIASARFIEVHYFPAVKHNYKLQQRAEKPKISIANNCQFERAVRTHQPPLGAKICKNV